MKPIRTALVIAAGILVGMAFSARPALADAPYECSGIGEEGRAAAQSVPHTLRLVFARPDGHYLGNVAARITDGGGTELVAAQCPGPWILLDLPAGTYKVFASFEGETKSRDVTVSGGQPQEQVFTF